MLVPHKQIGTIQSINVENSHITLSANSALVLPNKAKIGVSVGIEGIAGISRGLDVDRGSGNIAAYYAATYTSSNEFPYWDEEVAKALPGINFIG